MLNVGEKTVTIVVLVTVLYFVMTPSVEVAAHYFHKMTLALQRQEIPLFLILEYTPMLLNLVSWVQLISYIRFPTAFGGDCKI